MNPLSPFLKLWTEQVGIIDPARMGKGLKVARTMYADDILLDALARYISSPLTRVKRVEYFVQDLQTWLPSQRPLVDATGALTDDGTRVYER